MKPEAQEDEEQKEEESPYPDDSAMKNEESPAEDEAWGDGGDDEDGAGWDDYDEEEENPIVKEALEAMARKKANDEKIKQVRITFIPPGYREGQIARIVGDFTDWVPVTMHMHTVKQIEADPSKEGLFFVELKLAKGFRYRFSFEVDSTEMVDNSGVNPKCPNKNGKLTNFVEVSQDGEEAGTMTVEDFFSTFADDIDQNMPIDAQALGLKKAVSYVDGSFDVSEDIKKLTGYNTLMQGCGVVDVNTLESRTLLERMERHRAISDLLKVQSDSDEEEYEAAQRKKLSQIDREIIENQQKIHSRELRELT